MAAVSGQFGTVHIGASEFLEINNWKFDRKAAVHQYATNATNGYKKTVTGVKSGSGSISGLYDPSAPPENAFQPGDDVTLKLYLTATKFFEVPATIENIEYEVDLDEGEIVGWEAPFVADGEWTDPT